MMARGAGNARTSLLCALLVCAAAARGHEIPGRASSDLRIAVGDSEISMVVRAPVEALQDLELVLHPDGTLDPSRSMQGLADGASLWLGDFVSFAADGVPLASPRLQTIRLVAPNAALLAGPDLAVNALRLAAPQAPKARLAPAQWRLDALFSVPITASARGGELTINPRLAHLGVDTHLDLMVQTREGETRRLRVNGAPGPLPLEPGPVRVASSFLLSGIEHILGGVDHLLFLLCLVVPLLAWRPLVAVVTAFTAGHTLTLASTTLGWAPSGASFSAFVEWLIAGSVLWLALMVVLHGLGELSTRTPRWRLAFFFGLLHGYGFAFMLAEQMQFSAGHLFIALGAFTLGVELGQLLVIACALPMLALAFRVLSMRAVQLLVGVLVAHASGHWGLERWETFSAYGLAWPVLDLVFLHEALRGMLVAAIAFALYFMMGRLEARLVAPGAGRPDR